jgi:hypothetical protein
MSLQSHIDSLKTRHADLEARVRDEDSRPKPDAGVLVKLKLDKLRLKEELQRLSTSAAQH